MPRYSSCLVWLCLIMMIIQLSKTLNDDDSSSIEDHPLDRRSPHRVVKMLQQMLQRGEMQVHPHRIYEFLHRLHSRTSKY